MADPRAPRRAVAERTGGRLVYAVGDVHGRYDLLADLLGRIVADLAGWTGRGRPLLLFLGDYVDRGPDSAEVLEALSWLRRDARCELRLLKGNHEELMLDFLASPEPGGRWLQAGGRATLASYGVVAPERPDDPAACRAAQAALRAALPAAHRDLLQGLELIVTLGDYAFVHAGVRPGVPLAEQQPRDLLWIRDGFLAHPDPFEKRIVHGHSWTSPEPDLRGNRLGIDTGAFRTGVLTALRLSDGELAVLRTTGAPG